MLRNELKKLAIERKKLLLEVADFIEDSVLCIKSKPLIIKDKRFFSVNTFDVGEEIRKRFGIYFNDIHLFDGQMITDAILLRSQDIINLDKDSEDVSRICRGNLGYEYQKGVVIIENKLVGFKYFILEGSREYG